MHIKNHGTSRRSADFCKRLTTIEQVDVDGAGTYDEVRHKLDDCLAPFTDNQHLTQFYLKERNLGYDSSI